MFSLSTEYNAMAEGDHAGNVGFFFVDVRKMKNDKHDDNVRELFNYTF